MSTSEHPNADGVKPSEESTKESVAAEGEAVDRSPTFGGSVDSTRWLALMSVSLMLVVLGCYWKAIDGEFVFDDRRFVLDNTALWSSSLSAVDTNTESSNAKPSYDFGFFKPAVTDVAPDAQVNTNFRPLRFLSYQVDATLTEHFLPFEPGQEPSSFFFHLQNFIWHGLNTILVFLIARGLLPSPAQSSPVQSSPVQSSPVQSSPVQPGASSPRRVTSRTLAAFLIAILFALHPIHVESVAYVSGRRDVLFTFFYLSGVALYLWQRAGRPHRSLAMRLGIDAVLAGTFVLALLSKEMAATFPAVLVLLEFFCSRRVGRSVRWPWTTLAIVSIAGAVVVLDVLTTKNPGLGAPYWGGSWIDALWTSSRTMVRAAALFLWPDRLTIDYSYDAITPSQGPFDPITGIVSVALLGAIVVFAAWRGRRGHPGLWVGGALFVVLWSPVSQLVFPHPERFAERYLYLPSLALFWMLGVVLAPVYRRVPRALFALALVAVVPASVMTLDRLDDWETRQALWESAVEIHPRCARAQFQLGVLALEEGQREQAARRDGRALAARQRAARRLSVSHGLFSEIEGPSPWEDGLRRRAETALVSMAKAQIPGVVMSGSLADRFERVGDTTEAGQSITETAGFLLQHMELLARENRFEEATDTARALIEHPDANTNVRVRARLFLAGVAQQAGDLPEAELQIGAAADVAVSPNNKGLVAFQKGLILEQRESWKLAGVAYGRAAGYMSDSLESWSTAKYKQVECERKSGNLDQVRAGLEAVLERRPDHWPSVFSLADLDMAQSRLKAAESGFTRVWEATQDPRAEHGLRQIAVRRKLNERGETAPAASGTRVEVLLELARRRIREKKLSDAQTALLEAEKLAEGPLEKKRRLELRALAGEVAAMQEDWPGARKQFERYLEIAPVGSRDPVLLQYAEVLRRAGEVDSAYEFLKGEWEANCRHPRLAKNLGGLATMRRDRDAAIHWYEQYLAQEISVAERLEIELLVRRLETVGESSQPPPKS